MDNAIQPSINSGLTKPGEVGDFFTLVSMKSSNFCQKAKFKSPCQSFQVRIFSSRIMLFLQYSHNVPEMWPIQGLMINILFQTRWLHRFLDRFSEVSQISLTSPLSQEREKSSCPVFTMCGEPWSYSKVDHWVHGYTTLANNRKTASSSENMREK